LDIKYFPNEYQLEKRRLSFCRGLTPGGFSVRSSSWQNSSFLLKTNLASLKIGFTLLALTAEQIPEFQRSKIITAITAIIAVFLYILQYT